MKQEGSPSQDLIDEIESYPTNELTFRVETEIDYLIKWAEADLQHAIENNAESDIDEARDRLFNLYQAICSIRKSYKQL